MARKQPNAKGQKMEQAASTNETGPHADKPTVIVHASPTRCPRCDSTERSRYTNVTEQAYAGEAKDGRPYTHIIRRRCTCLKCGQSRIDRSLENRA